MSARVRREGDAWLVSGYDEALAVLRDPVLFSAEGGPAEARPTAFREKAAEWLFFMEPARHGPARAALNASFGAAVAQRGRAVVERAVAARVAGLPRRFDLVEDFALPLPISIVCEVTGMGEELARAARAVARADLHRADAACRAEGEVALERLSRETPERLALLMAGTEPTQRALAFGLVAWLEAGAPPATTELADELLRYTTPVRIVSRFTTDACTLGGARIERDAEVRVDVFAANRDPSRFAEPERLLPDRAPNPHLCFGAGPHACPGAWLARATLECALGRLPRVRLAEAPVLREVDALDRKLVRGAVVVEASGQR